MKIIVDISEKQKEKLQSIARIICGNSVAIDKAIKYLINNAEWSLGFENKKEQ